MPGKGSVRSVGAVANLRARMPADYLGHSGIAHLRWATHGEPTEKNAHPHQDCGGTVWVVHNGIIENYRELKEKLTKLGHTFASDTDTEVLAHLVEEYLKTEPSFDKAAMKALNDIKGTYGTAIQSSKHPDVIVGARMGAPVVLGLGKGENFIASDASPIVAHTKKVVYLEDGEVAVIKPDSHQIFTLDGKKVKRVPQTLRMNAEQAQKGGYEHFMLKEIMEEPEAVANTLRGRINVKKGTVNLEELAPFKKRLKKIDRVVLVACGTASYAALAGKYMLEEHGILAESDFGSEFRYRKPIINSRTLMLAISQSGETADTLEAVREGQKHGALTIGIVNTVGSTIARETDAVIYLHAGPEISVASTKAYLSQLTALSLLTLYLAKERGVSAAALRSTIGQLAKLPKQIRSVLDSRDVIQSLAEKYARHDSMLFIGRTFNYGTAFEGSLKMKETSYLHAEGCGAGEMKHGHLAIVDETVPTVAVALSDSVYEKMISNIQEIKARRGPVLAVATEGDADIATLADDVIYVPQTEEAISPIVAVVPLHLFAYYIAVARGKNVDRPRNLAKSVTVE